MNDSTVVKEYRRAKLRAAASAIEGDAANLLI